MNPTECVKEAMRQLKSLGLYKGVVDGIPGPLFQNAMLTWRAANPPQVDTPSPALSPTGLVDARSEGRIVTLLSQVRQPFRDLLIAINAEFAKQGKPWKWKWISGHRGKEEQNALYAQPSDGKDNDGDKRVDEADERVTGARFPYSAHNSGVAADGGVFGIDGSYIDEGIGYDIAGAIGRKMGFNWGADFGDRPHFALRPPSLRTFSETVFINEMAKRIVNNLLLWV